MHPRPATTENPLTDQAIDKTWHIRQGSAEASVLPTASVVQALPLPPLVLIAVVDSRCRCHDCHENCRDDPSLIESLARIVLLLYCYLGMILVIDRMCYLLE